MSLMTNEDKLFFEEKGYLLIRNYFSKSVSDIFRKVADTLQSTAEKKLEIANKAGLDHKILPQTMPGLIVVAEGADRTKISRIEDIFKESPRLKALSDA